MSSPIIWCILNKSRRIGIICIFLILFGSLIYADGLYASQPENIKVSNITSDRFTISWTTDIAESAQINYGATTALGNTAYDVRSQTFSGTTHYVTVTGLNPATTYYYDIVSGGVTYDNAGSHYTMTTGSLISPAAGSDIAYGLVYLSNGSTPAEGAMVYIKLRDNDGAGTSGDSQACSSLVGSTGYWYFDLKNVRNGTLNAYFEYSQTGDKLVVDAIGPEGGVALQVIDTSQDTPSPSMTLRINTPPVLEWTGESGYVSDGLDPEIGYGSIIFTFKIKYRDSDGDAPAIRRLYLDRNGDGDYIDPNESVDMTTTGSDYAVGVIYTYSTTITYSAGSQNCSYYFEFSDGRADAAGNITQAISPQTAVNKPDISQTLSVTIDQNNWSLTSISTGSVHYSNRVLVTNSGDGNQTYSLKITSEGIGWSASSDKNGGDINRFVLSAIFAGSAEAGIDSTYFNETANDDVILTTAAERAASTRFGSTRASLNGASVPAGAARGLWLEFKAPTKDSTRATHSVQIAIYTEAP